jgi:radical SAM superfamily enzyme YgiQ (UPF0313 family)
MPLPGSLIQFAVPVPSPRRRPDGKLRITLVTPRGPLYRHRGGIWKKTMRYAPLTLTTLASLVPRDMPAEVRIIDEGVEDLDAANIDADIVGLSAITGTAPRAYELSAQLRARGIPVVLGGVHPTLCPEEAMLHADSTVVGYAEESWPRLLRDFVDGRLRSRYDQSANLSLANLPFPDRQHYDRRLVNVAGTIEATRGCIFNCDFCVVPTAWGRRPLQKPVADVVADLKQMGTRRIIFLDLNLIADTAYAKELFTALIPLKLAWGGLVTTTIAWDEELLSLASRSGCRGLLIGFESLNPAALKASGKAFNSRRSYIDVMERIHTYNIAVMGCFVFGLDEDKLHSFYETVALVMDAKIDLPRYAIATPFPNTGLYNRLESEGRILTKDWGLYDGQHVVFEPKQMSADALLRNTHRAWKQTYSYRHIARRLAASRTQLSTSIPANFGYRFYANNLERFYTCDWQLAPNA